MHIVHGGVVEMKRNDHGWKLVSDSGCSLLVPDGPDGLAGIDYAEVPFVISVDNTDYIDEPGIDIEKMLEHIANCRSGGRTSCPSPHAWLEAWGDAENVIAFTLSAALSGSYNSAIAARHMGMRVAGLSSICNKAAGLGGELSHEEIIAAGDEASGRLVRIIDSFIQKI